MRANTAQLSITNKLELERIVLRKLDGLGPQMWNSIIDGFTSGYSYRHFVTELVKTSVTAAFREVPDFTINQDGFSVRLQYINSCDFNNTVCRTMFTTLCTIADEYLGRDTIGRKND